MKNVKYFQDLQDENIGGIADNMENRVYKFFGGATSPEWHLPLPLPPLVPKSVYFENYFTDKLIICSFSIIPFEEYKIIEPHLVRLSHRYYNDLIELDKRPFVLIKENDMDTIISAISKKLSVNQRLFHEPVEYCGSSNITEDVAEKLKNGDPFAVVKYKQEKYAKQHEYRLAVNTAKDNYTFSIGERIGEKVSIVD